MLRLISLVALVALCSCQNPGMTPESADASVLPTAEPTKAVPGGAEVEEAGPPPTTGSKEGPSEVAREIARKLAGDEAASEPTPSAESVEEMGRELFDALTSGDEKRVVQFELTDDEVKLYYSATMAQIVNNSRSQQNRNAWVAFEESGGLEAKLVGVQLADFPRRLDPAGARIPVSRVVDYVGEMRILYSLGEKGNAMIVKGLLHTPRGWRYLQLQMN